MRDSAVSISPAAASPDPCCLPASFLRNGIICPCCSAWSIGKKGELTEVACRKKAHGERVTAIALRGPLLYSGALARRGSRRCRQRTWLLRLADQLRAELPALPAAGIVLLPPPQLPPAVWSAAVSHP